MTSPLRHNLAFAMLVLASLSGCAGAAAKGDGASAVQAVAKTEPKNVIIFISDGCGYNHIAATDLFEKGKTGAQVYEQFPARVAVTTYSDNGDGYDPAKAWSDFNYVKKGTTDSAAAATAMASGRKTRNGVLGLDIDGQPLPNIMEAAEKKGMATGVVTTVPLSHATPAGFVAHNKSRNNYDEIAREMILTSAVDVIMGCGNPYYDENGKLVAGAGTDNRFGSSRTYNYVGGRETWEGLLAGLVGGDADGDGKPDPWTLIQTREQFQKLASGPAPKRVLGVPQVHTTLQQARSGDAQAAPFAVPLTSTVPTLAEMTRGALNVLAENPNGFVVMIEGGAIDSAAHANQTGRMIEEESDFNRAVEAAITWVESHGGWDRTLVIVTADHETGYLTTSETTPGEPAWSYKPLVNNGAGHVPGVTWNSKDHTNQLVPLFAKGLKAEEFTKRAVKTDPHRGPYADDTDVARVVMDVLK